MTGAEASPSELSGILRCLCRCHRFQQHMLSVCVSVDASRYDATLLSRQKETNPDCVQNEASLFASPDGWTQRDTVVGVNSICERFLLESAGPAQRFQWNSWLKFCVQT